MVQHPPKSIPPHPSAQRPPDERILDLQQTRTEGAVGAENPLLCRGKGKALAIWLPTAVPCCCPSTLHPVPLSTDALHHARATTCACPGAWWDHCCCCCWCGKRRRLPVISTSEGSLHFSEEENRMQEITSQLGWITAERRYGNPRKSSKELSKGRNLRSRTLLRSLFSCF